jgi:hypothetical protein
MMFSLVQSPRLAWLLSIAALWCAPPDLASQATGSITGRVQDDAGAAVYGASVMLLQQTPLQQDSVRAVRAAQTDALGAFRIVAVPAGEYRLRISRIGNETYEEPVEVTDGARKDVAVRLARSAIELEGVTVETSRSRERATFEEAAGATVREITREEMIRLPGIAETDPLRAVEVLPGVVSTSDFSSAFHVRGGSADQNLILLDGVPVISPFHLGGLFSVFNADMLRRAELQSGGFSAEHGGRVSSVLTIESDPGDGRFRVDAGFSLLATRVAVAGGLPSGVAHGLGLQEARWRASIRRSYLDVVLRPVFDFPYVLTDFQAVFEGWMPSGDRISMMAYSGSDAFNLGQLDPESFPLRLDWNWGNDALGARWTHARGDGGSAEVSLGFTRFGSSLGFPQFDDTRFTSAIDQTFVRGELTSRPRDGWRVQTGATLERLSFDNLAEAGGTVFGGGLGNGWLTGGHALAEWTRPDRWIVEAGVRLDSWMANAGGADVELAPRIAAKRFLNGGTVAVKGAVGRYTQFLHSLRDEEVPIGLDIWVLTGESAPAVTSDQVQGAVEAYLPRDWFVSVEAYRRSFDGVVTFNVAEDPGDESDDILAGKGTAHGIDFLVRKDGDAWGGWMAVSLLRARRTFQDVLAPPLVGGGQPVVEFSPIFDRHLDLDIVLRMPLPWSWEGGARWNLSSGSPYTRPRGTFAYFRPRFVDRGGRYEWNDDEGDYGKWAVALGDRNAERYPSYHRLDVSASRTFKKSWGSITPSFDVLNVYNHRNILFYYYEYQHEPPRRWGVSMFPFLPTFGVEVTFR